MVSASEACKTYEQKVIDWRRYLHMNPEPSYKEFKTVEFLKRELDAMGVPYENIEGTLGFAGIVEGAIPGKAVALRADMDALPVTEETGVPYKSKTDGLMHACGHDAHMAMLLGAAAVLNERREFLQGTVYICFQSAEEIGGGALEIVKYLQSKGGIGRAVSLHIWSSVPAGEIILLPGATMSGLFAFDVVFKGEGGHGSRLTSAMLWITASCTSAKSRAALGITFSRLQRQSRERRGFSNSPAATVSPPRLSEWQTPSLRPTTWKPTTNTRGYCRRSSTTKPRWRMRKKQ